MTVTYNTYILGYWQTLTESLNFYRIVAKSVTLRARSVMLPEEISTVHLATKDMFYSGECACLGYAALDTIKMQMM